MLRCGEGFLVIVVVEVAVTVVAATAVMVVGERRG